MFMFFCNYEFKSQNETLYLITDIIPHNCNFISHDCDIISHNCEVIAQNWASVYSTTVTLLLLIIVTIYYFRVYFTIYFFIFFSSRKGLPYFWKLSSFRRFGQWVINQSSAHLALLTRHICSLQTIELHDESRSHSRICWMFSTVFT